AQPLEHVTPPCSVIDPIADRFAKLPVTRNVDTELLLTTDHVTHRHTQGPLKRRFVGRLADLTGAVRLDQFVGTRQAPCMARQNAAGAGSHDLAPQGWRLASAAPCASASSLAQAMSGWIRPPSPQSVEAMTRSRPTSFAKRRMRSATSSGCSTTLVAWLTTPGKISLPSGSLMFSQTRHSCSWRTLPASNE